LQQYKYRRRFPYNNTIQEESAENLTENKSTLTFKSRTTKALFHEVRTAKNHSKKFSFDLNPKEESIFRSQDINLKNGNLILMKSETLINDFCIYGDQNIVSKEEQKRNSHLKMSNRYIKSIDDLQVSASIYAKSTFFFEFLNSRFIVHFG
jgi:hypothetical protein